MGVKENLSKLKNVIPDHVKLVAVSKTKPVDDIIEAYEAGQRMFGENKAQEMASKQPDLPGDIRWHFIGHLQTNKVKYLVPFVEMIESVDRMKLLREIDKQARKAARRIDCLLQFHIAEEETKFGLDMAEARALLEDPGFGKMDHVRICGVMGMATFTEDMERVRREFRSLKKIFQEIKTSYFPDEPSFKEISMGMSGDYHIAIEEGSSIVRIGSLIFGERNY